jgi:hypothetical protein
MLGILKNTIRKKKLFFTVKASEKNVKQLYSFLFNNIITGFSISKRNKQTFLIVFINYCYNFDPSITSISVNSKKISTQQNCVVDLEFLGSNFVVNSSIKGNVHPIIKVKNNVKSKHCLKFR